MMIAVPVLALKEMEESEPHNVLGRVFAWLSPLAHVSNAIDEALHVQ